MELFGYLMLAYAVIKFIDVCVGIKQMRADRKRDREWMDGKDL